MNLLEVLKQFKSIRPDENYSAVSRRSILARAEAVGSAFVSRPKHSFWRIVETGAAVALTGFFMLLITGAFNEIGLTPKYSAIDPGALHAEAQAIDIQIKLANLNYSSPSTLAAIESESTTSAAAAAGSSKNSPAAGIEGAASVAAPTSAASSATGTATSTELNLDQALEGLAQ